jgi:amino acid adenylation domain-containing protein
VGAENFAQKDQFAQERLLVGDDLQAKLAQLAKSNQCTVNVIMQFAWSFVLAKYSNSNDVIIGTTVSGRPADLVGIEKILGLFINTIPARTVFDDEQTISNALKARHAQNVHGEAFSYLSLARVQQLAGLPAGEELFDTLFVFENYPSIISVPNERGQQNSLRIDSVSALEHSNYPLTVIVTAQDKLAITLDYKTQHFSRKTISQVMKHYRNVLNCITEVGDSAKVKELTMLSASEKQRIFQQLQGQAVELPKDKCIHELFEQQAKAIPNKVAVEFGEEQLSYEQLNHQANQVAHCLLAAVKAEPSLQSSHNQLSIGVCFERSLDMLVAIVGILKAGFHYVPLDPEYPTNRLELISRNANMFRVLTCGNVADKLSTLDCEVLVFSAMDLANYSTSNIPLQEAGINSNSIAYSIYTSGSTGVPKGVALRHRNAVAMLTGAYHEYSEAELSRVLFSTSLNFDLSVFEMFLPLCFGYQCVMVKSILSLLEQEIRVSLVATVPSAIKTLLESDGIPSDVKVITLGGEALGANVVNGLLDNGHCQKVVNIYGPTEDTTYSTSSAYTSHTHVAPNIGRIVPNAQGYILSPDLTPVPYGATGELYMSGAGVTAGYVNSESLTEQRFLKNPFYEPALDDSYQVMYKTGDLVKLLPDGNLAFVCREDEQVKVNGVRIELGEIEHALSRCDGVDSAVVMARQLDAADRLNNQLVAFIKSLQFADADFDEKTLINQTKDALIAVLPSTMLPNRFVVLEDWPLNPNGKIDKNQLAKTYSSLVQNNSQSTKKSTARSDQYETKLLEIWKDLLQLQDIGLDEGFFDVGGNSLTIVSMVNRLNKQFGVTIQLTDAFAYPTISSLANYLRDLVAPADLHNKLSIDSGNNNLPENEPKKNDDPIAIIGMAGQFPDARDIAEFWHNIETGRESLQTFTREQLTEAGYVDKQLNDPYFVSKGVIHQNVKEFDADFFGFTPRQAEIMDPQQRMLFEATQHTLDDAGYGDTDIPQKIGVFVGCSDSQYLFNNIIPNIELMTSLYQEVAQSNSNTYSASRLAFKFNLTGPAVSVATACSTSLVAIHQAITSIQSGDCEMALAGGSSVANLGPVGYHFQEGNIASEDGHCRAFDDSASGTRSGNGVGMLLLKPLSKALEDGDQVHAVIKGTAINNDGHVKIGYTAPSVAGQSEVIAKALQKAKVKPAQVQYIETHGTGTRLGDPIEIRALNKVFQSQISNSIALGTLKPNIGHTDIAAGVAGVIKTVAAIKARKMPKCINFEKPNQEIDFANSPFYINTETKDWPEIDDTRTASISSFGIGGTNAHAVIQQAPKLALAQEAPVQNWHQPQLLLLSANSEASLKQMSAELADYIATDQAASLSDIAYTLQVGRKRLPFRQYYVVASKEQAVEQLRSGQDHCAVRSQYKNADVYFMFSGQGTQYEGMAKDLYQSETIFRKVMDRCAAQIKAHLSIDILERIYPKKRTQEEKYAHSINDTLVTQPALFAIEYSLAQLLMSWGVKPAGAIGHSLGEYVAATVAGVFSLEDAIRLVCKRAEIMQKVEPGAMVSVVLNETECQALADEYACDLAAVNAPDRCVISGALHAIDALQAEFESNDIVHTRLKTSHAFHSRMMDPVLKEFNAVLSDIQMSSPRLPVISNVTGQYLTDDLVSSSDYWVDHLRGTIKFGAGLDTLLTDANKNNSCFVEVGLGNILCQLGQLASSGGSARFVPSLKGVNSTEDDHSVLQALLGELWKQGVSIDWRNISGNEANRKVSLPPYPFDRKIHWIEASRNNRPAAVEVDCLQAKDAVEQWLYEPVWNAVVKNGRNNLKGSVQQSVEAGELDKSCLIFEDRAGISRQIGEQIKAQGITPIYVAQSDEYQRLSATQYQLVAGDKSGFMQLASDMTQDNYAPSFILHGWLIDDNLIDDAEQCGQQLNDELLSLLHLCQALDENGIVQDVKLTVLSNKTQYFDEDDVVQPGKAGLLGVCRVIPAEYRNMDFQSIDIELTDQGQLVGKKALSKLVDCIVSSSRILHRTMCLRGNQLWHQSYEQLQKPESEEQSHSQALLKNDGVYVITGGLSGIGVSLAEHIAASVKAKLVLVGRSEFVARESWDNWIAEHGTGEQTSQAIARIRAMENHGSEVLIMQADATLRSDVAALKDRVQQEFGLVDGIIHSAGVPGSGLMSLKTPEMIAAVLKPKVLGTLLLAEAFENDQPDFFVNCSSLAPVVGGVGQYEYCAANAFQDAFSYAQQSSNTRFISINWDSWSQVGMAVKAVNKMSNSNSPIVHIKDAMTPEEGKQVFDLILRKSQPQVIVSRNEINARVKHIEELMKTQEVEVIKPTGLLEDDRPVLNIKYVEPKFALEIGLAEIWSSVLGIERIGVDDHFFDLGGDSLLLSGIVTRINKKWDVRFPLKTAFEKPTIKEMTQSLATHINVAAESDLDDCEYEEEVI